MRRRSTTGVLSALLAMSILTAACSGDKPAADAKSSAPATQAAASTPAAQASSSALGTEVSSSAPATETSPAATSDEKVTIEYLNFSANGGHEKNVAAIAEAFQKENPNITVKIKTLPNDGYFTALQTAVAGSNAPDTFELNYENFSSYADNGVLAELQGVDESAYVPDLINGFKYNGKLYGLPAAFQAGILAYNKDLFDAAGVSYPTEDWTWADAEKAAKAITKPDKNIWGLQQPAHFWEFYSTLAAAGGQFFNADKTAAAFNSPEGLEAWKWITGKSGVIAPPVNKIAGIPDIESTMFKKGQLGMWQVASGAISGLRETKANWDIQIVPKMKSNTAYAFVNMIGVSAKSKNAEAAQKWASFFTASPVMVTQRVESSWDLPAITDQSQFAAWIADAPPASKKAVLVAATDTVYPPTLTGKQNEMQDALNEELTAVVNKQKTPEEGIADAEKRVDALLKK